MVAMTPKKKTWMPKSTARTREARQGSKGLRLASRV